MEAGSRPDVRIEQRSFRVGVREVKPRPGPDGQLLGVGLRRDEASCQERQQAEA